PPRFSASPYTTLFRSGARGRPGPAGKAAPAGRAAVADGARGGAVVAVTAGGGPPGLARRVQRHRAGTPRYRVRRPGRRLGSDLPDRKSTRLNSSHVKI